MAVLITNSATLMQTVADWINRSDMAGSIPNFLQAVENEIDNQLRTIYQIVQVTMTTNVQQNALPSDWLETLSLWNKGQTPDLPLMPVKVDEIAYLAAQFSGTPTRYYAISGSNMLIAPNPAVSTDFTHRYYGKIPSINSNTTNWLVTRDPYLYLYGALAHAAPYMDDDARAPMWMTEYQRRMQQLQAASEKARFGGQSVIGRTKNVF